MSTKEVVKELSEKGVKFLIEPESESGCTGFFLQADQVVAYKSDPVKIIAECFGVSAVDYLQWCEEEYSIRCSALTRQKRRCNNIATGGHNVSAFLWSRRQGEYCEVHDSR